MKTRNWTLGLAVMLALLVGASATTANAAVSFTYTFDGCTGDTVCVTPTLNVAPDSVRWFYRGGALAVRDVATPFDTCFVYASGTPGRDSLVMTAYYTPDPDSTSRQALFSDYLAAVNDGVTVSENDSILINVLVNDTTSTPDSNVVIAPYLAIINGPFNGTVPPAVGNNAMVWYVPDPGYNGTDNFVYQVTNECGLIDTAVVSTTIQSDGILSITCDGLEWGNLPCDAACGDGCDDWPAGTISKGDSIRFCATLALSDLDELSANWPVIDLPGWVGTSLPMERNPNDTTQFCWPGFEADSTPTWYFVPEGTLDIEGGIYEIVVRARSSIAPNNISACTTVVDQAIDNNDPDLGAGEASWTLWHDVDGNGVVTTVDTMRFFIDLRNEPFEEICGVSVRVYGFPTTADTGILANEYCLYEIAGDNRWALVLTGGALAGDLEDADGPFTAVFHYWDNACNEDSTSTQYNGPVDNTAPDCDCIEWVYEAVDDLDDNGCIGLGELVRISARDTCNGDVEAFYVDLFSDTTWRLGLGVDDEADSSHIRVLLPSIGGGWYGIEWELGKFPLGNAIDTTAVDNLVPWVFLHAEDDAGNPLSCDSLALVWTDLGIDIDARAPFPVQIDSCVEAETFTGRRAVHVYFTDTAAGAAIANFARMRLFYDNATGVIDYVDTLAGLNWDDTLGGTGTNGIHHVGADEYYWTTDGTVELSWCRDYLFNIWVIDDCGNLEYVHPDSVLCPGERPAPVTYLDCDPQDSLNICLEWKTAETSADSFCVFMASDGAFDTAVWVATVYFVDTATVYTWCTDDANLDLVENRWYDFIVYTYDSCGNRQEQDATSEEQSFVTQCLADLAPPLACVFQPAEGGSYSCQSCDFLDNGTPSGFYIYVKADLPGSTDLTDIDSVLVRLKDDGGSPGEWTQASFTYIFQGGSDNLIAVWLNDCQLFDSMVGEGNSDDLELIVFAHDQAGNSLSLDEIYDACGGWDFTWVNTASTIDITVTTVNGNVRTYQPYCDLHGFEVGGPSNEVEVCLTGGLAPYKIRMEVGQATADSANEVVYVENVYAACTTLTFSAEGFSKGAGQINVYVCDASGSYTSDNENICVPDTIPPCALIANPVDGKCIRRSRSMIDPVDVCVEINPVGNCLDPNEIVKIDFQWSQACCTGTILETIRVCDSTPDSSGGTAICDTFPDGATGIDIDSVICVDTGFGGYTIRCRDSVVEVPCENVYQWNTFSIFSGDSIGGPTVCVEWWNTEDLAWVTESGTIIYLRAILYDDQGNEYITPCVQTCVDIDTPPLCLETPDACWSEGKKALGGGSFQQPQGVQGLAASAGPYVTFYATLDMALGNVDDIEDVTLWYKKSSDPDQYEFWISDGSGFLGGNPGGTNSTVWRWDFDISQLQDNIDYDFRVIAKTIYGMYSYDYNGDNQFDANTFDSTACDMNTYFVDRSAPQVAIDSVWTDVNGLPVIQPNVSCTMSDPRGWVWAQYGQPITVQPNVYPWYDVNNTPLRDDIKRVQWTLWKSDSASCGCGESNGGLPSQSSFSGAGSSWVIAINEGANPLEKVTFNPADAPFLPQVSGFQTAVLQVQVWDSCGNVTEDCIKLYLLDVDPTDAIIISPMNGEVFCTEPGSDAFNGITIQAASILDEGWNKAIFAYRALGSSTWIDFDSVGVSGNGDGFGTFSTTWNPSALGLPDGAYELTVWAVDNALNRSTNNYVITVYLSCAVPTVALVYPTLTDPSFIGCDIELEATAESSDPANPIDSVTFYYVSVTGAIGSATRIGSDGYSVDDHWGYHWLSTSINSLADGPYYIFARAWNKAGKMAQSELVWVNVDNTNPWAVVTQVDGDLSNGGSGDPTVVQAGDQVDLWGLAKDNNSPWGYGAENNCGVDSVVFYVYNSTATTKMAGYMATPDNVIDSQYTAIWNTASFAAGTYRVRMTVFDCACNSGSSNDWYVRVDGPDQEPVLSVEGPFVCGNVTIDEDLIATVTPSNPDYVNYIDLSVSNTMYSDVWDRYSTYTGTENADGSWSFDPSASAWDDGIYRVRAVVHYTDGTVSDDGVDSDAYPDDFTFTTDKAYHMLVRVSHSVTPFTVTTDGTTIKAHEDICFDVNATDECDIDHLHFGAEFDDTTYGNNYDSLHFCFDPLDSGKVTLNNCKSWTGDIYVTACDVFGHCEAVATTVWILDVNANQVAITGPSWSEYVTPTSNTVTARKLSSSGIDSVQFYYSTAETNGTVKYIGSSVASGDEFSATWNIDNVNEGQYWLYGKAFDNNAGVDGPRCPATVAKGCVAFNLIAPNPSYTRTVNGQTFTFVGEHADLCVDRATITSISNGVGIDSIVWQFRSADVPGVTIDGNLDPNLGWVRIDSDVYGSLCVDWFTNWCDVFDGEGACCPDGKYTVVAWVYDKAGNVCHSVPMNVMIDVSDPYSEIVDIDGDETFGTCHEVILPSDSVVKFTANAIDDHSCVDLEPYPAWNSGAKYLQFFVGECGGGGGCVDIVFVQDGSGSMGDDQAAIATNAQLFATALGSVDYRLGVLGYDGNYDVIGTDGSRTAAAAGNGVFTTDVSAFQTMITAVGDAMGGTENGLTAMNQALTAYPFRNNCNKVLILITDEDADDFADYATLFPTIVSSGAVVFGVISFGDSAGYSQLGTATGGELFDITANWGANLAALAGQIQALAGGNGNDVGIVWGKTVTLTDGQDNAFALWNPTGLEPGEYCAWTVVIDNVGNSYTSSSREICIVDKTPPVAMITGFGKSTDEHMVNTYTIYGATWDSDVDYVQFQYRPTGSNSETDWTGIGISSTVNNDSTCWMTTWNPCVLSGSFDLRVVPTDKNGNQDFTVQPIATVTLSNCAVTPSGASTSAATIWFEDRTFDDLGLVHVDQDNTSDDYHNIMIGVWADLTGDLTVEKIDLWTPDPDLPSWKSGSFDGSDAIKLGGEGWFWQSYTDASNRTHLKREIMTVWPVKAAVGACNSTHPSLGAKVCIEPGALSADNGIVVFPSRLPTLNLSQQHFQAWPAVEGTRFPLVTAIRLTDAVEGFNTGKYARVTIKYADLSLVSSNLGVAWWDDDEWNANEGLIAGGEIGNGSATFHSTNLFGLYAVVSAGRVCNSGAITVENAGAERAYGNVLGPWPTIYTRVRSNIEFNNQNRDINEDEITVVLDGNVTLYANGDNPDNGWYNNDWDEVTGILTTSWNRPSDCLTDDDYDGESDGGAYAPALTAGPHTLLVQAFSKSGYCKENTYTFTVDRTAPDVTVVGYEDCANPTFNIKITDDGGAGVDWDNVFIDVFDVTGSEFDALPKSRLIHTETYDAFDQDLNTATGEFSFQLVDHIAQGRRLRIVIYVGDRYVYFNSDCNCEYVEYDHDCDGVQDRVGNNTQIVEEQFTIWGSSCSGGGGTGDGNITIQAGPGSSNPFDPWAGGEIIFNLNGFDGGGIVTADVYDLAGVKVANIHNSTVQSVVGEVKWNGRNEDAEYVAQGVYLVHFASTGGQAGGPTSQVLKVVVKRGSTASN